ncbi:MAG: malonate decarboxylase acyl carrier protein [Acetobacteraceae bacterium]
MVTIKLRYTTRGPATGRADSAIVGVVASGNLEVLLERILGDTDCSVEIATPVRGYDEVWQAVVADFVERASPGGLRISINDAGARPDTVALRLMQGVTMMEGGR